MKLAGIDANVLIGGGLALAVLWALANAKNAGMAAGQAIGNAAGGLVIGAGKSVGIPETNPDQCSQALADGRLWDASFACPAGTFLGGAWDRLTGNGAATAPLDAAPGGW